MKVKNSNLCKERESIIKKNKWESNKIFYFSYSQLIYGPSLWLSIYKESSIITWTNQGEYTVFSFIAQNKPLLISLLRRIKSLEPKNKPKPKPMKYFATQTKRKVNITPEREREKKFFLLTIKFNKTYSLWNNRKNVR